MKKFLINMVLESVMDYALIALKSLAMKSSSTIDDKMVDLFNQNKAEIIAEIKQAI